MAKSKLEQILLEADKTQGTIDKLVEENTKEVLRATMKEEISSFLKNAILESEGDEELEDTPMDDESGDMEDLDNDSMEEPSEEGEDSEEYEETDIDDTDEEPTDFDMDDEGEYEDSEEGEDGIDLSAGMEDFEGDEDDSMEGGFDMENASVEDLLDYLKSSNVPDGETITITKNSTFSLGSGNGNDPMAGGIGAMGENKKPKPFGKKAPKLKLDEVEAMDEEMNENENVFEIEMEEEEAKKIAEAIRRDKRNISEKRNLSSRKQVSESVAKMQSQIKRLININDSLIRENKDLKRQNDSAAKSLELSEQNIKKLALSNTNLALVTRLFTENSTTKEEKVKILKSFDKSTNPDMSKKIFNKLNENLKKGKTDKPINENQKSGIEAAAKNQSQLKNKTTIKENTVTIKENSEVNRALDLMKYKSTN